MFKALCAFACLFAFSHGFSLSSSVKGVRAVHSEFRLRSQGLRMSAAEEEFVPDMNRRNLMNLVLVGGVGATVAGAGIPYLLFFVPTGVGGEGAGLLAKDALGNDVKSTEWLETHLPGSRGLVQGFKGDATYLIVNENKEIEKFALNAVCTHLGCVVPWSAAEKKFICPCHGSQYDATGKVVRGPAPLSLALAHVETDTSGKVLLTPWTETDFRTGDAPWWK